MTERHVRATWRGHRRGIAILKTGAAASVRYVDGVAVFVKPIGGVMVEAALGVQQFTFQPG